jgi:hypothetical protein
MSGKTLDYFLIAIPAKAKVRKAERAAPRRTYFLVIGAEPDSGSADNTGGTGLSAGGKGAGPRRGGLDSWGPLPGPMVRIREHDFS